MEQISASFIVISIILSTIVVGTMIGNVFVIVAILVDKNLQTSANQLVLSLAVADLMVACLVMPLGAYNDLYQGWWLGKEVCEFWTSADVLCCTASILNLLAIALDRYWAVTSVDYIYKRTKRRVNMMIMYAWAVGAIVSLAPIFGWKDPDFANRVLVEHKCMVSQDVGYQIFATISTFYAPLVLLLALYWRIFKVARKRIRRKAVRNNTNTNNNNNNNNNSEPVIEQQGGSTRKLALEGAILGAEAVSAMTTARLASKALSVINPGEVSTASVLGEPAAPGPPKRDRKQDKGLNNSSLSSTYRVDLETTITETEDELERKAKQENEVNNNNKGRHRRRCSPSIEIDMREKQRANKSRKNKHIIQGGPVSSVNSSVASRANTDSKPARVCARPISAREGEMSPATTDTGTIACELPGQRSSSSSFAPRNSSPIRRDPEGSSTTPNTFINSQASAMNTREVANPKALETRLTGNPNNCSTAVKDKQQQQQQQHRRKPLEEICQFSARSSNLAGGVPDRKTAIAPEVDLSNQGSSSSTSTSLRVQVVECENKQQQQTRDIIRVRRASRARVAPFEANESSNLDPSKQEADSLAELSDQIENLLRLVSSEGKAHARLCRHRHLQSQSPDVVEEARKLVMGARPPSAIVTADGSAGERKLELELELELERQKEQCCCYCCCCPQPALNDDGSHKHTCRHLITDGTREKRRRQVEINHPRAKTNSLPLKLQDKPNMARVAPEGKPTAASTHVVVDGIVDDDNSPAANRNWRSAKILEQQQTGRLHHNGQMADDALNNSAHLSAVVVGVCEGAQCSRRCYGGGDFSSSSSGSSSASSSSSLSGISSDASQTTSTASTSEASSRSPSPIGSFAKSTLLIIMGTENNIVATGETCPLSLATMEAQDPMNRIDPRREPIEPRDPLVSSDKERTRTRATFEEPIEDEDEEPQSEASLSEAFPPPVRSSPSTFVGSLKNQRASLKKRDLIKSPVRARASSNVDINDTGESRRLALEPTKEAGKRAGILEEHGKSGARDGDRRDGGSGGEFLLLDLAGAELSKRQKSYEVSASPSIVVAAKARPSQKAPQIKTPASDEPLELPLPSRQRESGRKGNVYKLATNDSYCDVDNNNKDTGSLLSKLDSKLVKRFVVPASIANNNSSTTTTTTTDLEAPQVTGENFGQKAARKRQLSTGHLHQHQNQQQQHPQKQTASIKLNQRPGALQGNQSIVAVAERTPSNVGANRSGTQPAIVSKPSTRSLDLRRKFRALGQLVSFVATNKSINSTSSGSGGSRPSSMADEGDDDDDDNAQDHVIEPASSDRSDIERGVVAGQERNGEMNGVDEIDDRHRKLRGKLAAPVHVAQCDSSDKNCEISTIERLSEKLMLTTDRSPAADVVGDSGGKQLVSAHDRKHSSGGRQVSLTINTSSLSTAISTITNNSVAISTAPGTVTTNYSPLTGTDGGIDEDRSCSSANAHAAAVSLALKNNQLSQSERKNSSFANTNNVRNSRSPRQLNNLTLSVVGTGSRRRQRENLEIKREKKAAKTLAIITGVFVCCWLPFFLNAIIMPICGQTCTPSDLILSILLWLGYLNSLLNPIIYTIFSPDFRRAFRRLLCWPELLDRK